MGQMAGPNRYVYANQNPLSTVDPYGLCGLPCLALRAAGVVGLVEGVSEATKTSFERQEAAEEKYRPEHQTAKDGPM